MLQHIFFCNPCQIYATVLHPSSILAAPRHSLAQAYTSTATAGTSGHSYTAHIPVDQPQSCTPTTELHAKATPQPDISAAPSRTWAQSAASPTDHVRSTLHHLQATCLRALPQLHFIALHAKSMLHTHAPHSGQHTQQQTNIHIALGNLRQPHCMLQHISYCNPCQIYATVLHPSIHAAPCHSLTHACTGTAIAGHLRSTQA